MRLQAFIHTTQLLLCMKLIKSADFLKSELEEAQRTNNASVRLLGRRKRRKPASAATKTNTDITPSNRIVGGDPPGRGTYPFIVALHSSDDPSTSLPICGEFRLIETDLLTVTFGFLSDPILMMHHRLFYALIRWKSHHSEYCFDGSTLR